MKKLIDIKSEPVISFLKLLLQDKTTGRNIIWGTDSYQDLGIGFSDTDSMEKSILLGQADIMQPRIQKSLEVQQARTRKKAEVFTPAWLCNQMNNDSDAVWFGRSAVFNQEQADHTWTVQKEKIIFPIRKYSKTPGWQRYVDSRRLEITCGEAPYLVSRYDASTGEPIYPLERRIGQLDRKLRVINENTTDYETWLKWTFRAFEATYGYEYQGDNLLIARINLFLTFVEYYQERWGKKPEGKVLKKIANRIAWNLWQMDGLQNTTPIGKRVELYVQPSLFATEVETLEQGTLLALPCKVYDWRRDNALLFGSRKRGKTMGKKLFDFVIGNPPYQVEQNSDNIENSKKNYSPPVYNIFMDAAIDVGSKIELIHPARFLFNAGSTPKKWNEKMLDDKHFKVLKYEADSNKIFPGLTTPIKGGIAITYRDENMDFGSISAFNQYEEVNTILHKVIYAKGFKSLMNIVFSRTVYRLTDKMHQDHPDALKKLSKGHAFDMASNIFERLPELFYDEKPNDRNDYIGILGRLNNTRTLKYIRADYINNVENRGGWKLFIPQANGNGTFGETISQPQIEGPEIGHTETFISIGNFKDKSCAENLFSYICTKFARTLLSVLKVTQNGNKPVWKYVPLQDFTTCSDIDWSKSIHDIDLQLYKKYGLDEKEIAFIESHVKEMG